MGERNYLRINEAAARYHVSRVKLWRLIQSGRLTATKDPRDERAKLVREEDVARILTPADQEAPPGLTPERVAQMDAFVERVFHGRKVPGDSTELIRRERVKRTRHLVRILRTMKG